MKIGNILWSLPYESKNPFRKLERMVNKQWSYKFKKNWWTTYNTVLKVIINEITTIACLCLISKYKIHYFCKFLFKNKINNCNIYTGNVYFYPL